MKTTKSILIAAIILILAACHSKKSVTSTASSSPATTTSTITPPANVSVARSSDGIYPPGNTELAAIQMRYTQYKDVTLDKLTEGYTIYTKGACVKCHNAKNIYRISETGWYPLITDMSLRAKLTDAEQDAIYKYVFAIKAAQPKDAK